MAKEKEIDVVETINQLKNKAREFKKGEVNFLKVEMLRIMRMNNIYSNSIIRSLMLEEVSATTIGKWKNLYLEGGIDLLLKANSKKSKLMNESFLHLFRYIYMDVQEQLTLKDIHLILQQSYPDITYSNFMKFIKKKENILYHEEYLKSLKDKPIFEDRSQSMVKKRMTESEAKAKKELKIKN